MNHEIRNDRLYLVATQDGKSFFISEPLTRIRTEMWGRLIDEYKELGNTLPFNFDEVNFLVRFKKVRDEVTEWTLCLKKDSPYKLVNNLCDYFLESYDTEKVANELQILVNDIRENKTIVEYPFNNLNKRFDEILQSATNRIE